MYPIAYILRYPAVPVVVWSLGRVVSWVWVWYYDRGGCTIALCCAMAIDLLSFSINHSLAGKAVRYCATLMFSSSSSNSSMCSEFPSLQSSRPTGEFSCGCRSCFWRYFRYNSICPLYSGLNLPNFRSIAIRRFNLRW